MSVDFFSDKVSCIVPRESYLSRDFVHSACWIQGFYVYEELKDRPLESGYYGIPKDVELDGITSKGKLCRKINKATHLRDLQCHSMTKLFYLQFQYFPFFLASLAILYYMPYILFRMNNVDLISLKSNLKSENLKDIDATKLIDNYFNYSMNGGKNKLRLKILLNLGLKILYVIVNALGFICMNTLLNYNYKTYGMQWIQWSRLNNSIAFDNNGDNGHRKPGNILLPAMGFCEITEGSTDVRSSYANQNKFICEISPNVLYQYVLLVLWFLFVISIVISNLGVCLLVGTHMWTSIQCYMFRSRNVKSVYTVCKNMTLREIDYTKFIQAKNLPLYGDVIRTLQERSTKKELAYDMEEEMRCKNSPLLPGNIS